MKVAIIHARGGSKRIPKKNIKLFHDKPIMAYPIAAAKESGVFDRIIVSTDSPEIAEVAKQYGAEVPYFRAAEFADDYTPTQAVLLNDVQILNKEAPIEYACCIYATAAFCTAKYLQEGLNILKNKDANTAFSVTTFDFPIYRALKTNTNGALELVYPEHKLTRSQDLPETFHDAGQFYWVNVQKFIANPVLYSDNSYPVTIPRYLVQDIDTLEDWQRAEYMYTTIKNSTNFSF
ncbi:MAG: neuA [Rickettsiaceae bacterium]|jgi:pseudaminic acid cytidylyltransferase|nr:neuA [Rickettsiaceae bacterium]